MAIHFFLKNITDYTLKTGFDPIRGRNAGPRRSGEGSAEVLRGTFSILTSRRRRPTTGGAARFWTGIPPGGIAAKNRMHSMMNGSYLSRPIFFFYIITNIAFFSTILARFNVL